MRKSIENRLKTLEKRKNQICKTYELKIINNSLNLQQKEFLQKEFLEAKWLYNDIVASNNIFNYDTKISFVNVLNKNKEIEKREFNYLSHHIRDEILNNIKISIKGLSSRKKKGFKVGYLKFKSEINSIPLKAGTYFINKNKIRIQKLGKIGKLKYFKLKGLEQIPNNVEYANAYLIRKPSGYYIKIVTFVDKDKIVSKIIPEEIVGIDFGIKHSLTLSNGVKIDAKFELPKQIIRNQRRLSKKKKNSKNYIKQKNKLRKSYEKYTNYKKDNINKVVNYLKTNYKHIAVQNENIRGWQSSRFGKYINRSILGGIISAVKQLPQTAIIDKYFPSTKLCPSCGCINKITLADRTYTCECGYIEDRDVHAAKNLLIESVPMERRDFKTVELNTTALESLKKHSGVSIDYEAGTGKSLGFSEVHKRLRFTLQIN